MSVLTKSELMDLNKLMLGLGAPFVLDGVGYNKVDYSKMFYLSSKSNLTDEEAYAVSLSLLKYKNTQLSGRSNDINETVQHYNKMFNSVKIVDFDKDSVKISWDYNTKVSEFIKKSFDRDYYKWLRPNGNWVLDVKWDGIDQLTKVFNDNGFDTTQVLDTHVNLDEIMESKPVESVVLKVSRPDDTVDTLVIEFSYNKEIVNALKNVPYTFFNKKNKTWEIYIEYSKVLYDSLEGLNMKNLDTTQLKPWAELVSGWSKNYEPIDLSTCPLKFKPYDFQIEDINKLLKLKVALNANDMGAGKTMESVAIGESIPMKKLVICPPTLRINWKKEILHINPNANVNILYSADEFAVVDGWNIIGYNSLDKFLKELEAEMFQVVFIDEAHYIQAVSNSGAPESHRAYAVLRLAATANYVYPITGTPKTNRNKNLFNILRVIRHPLTRGKWAFSNYGRVFCDGRNNGWGWDYNGNSNDEELNKQLEPVMIRHLKKDVLPHLKKQRIITPVEVDLREYHYEISQYLNNRTNKNAEDLARLMRARKILATQKVGESIDFTRDLIADGKKVVIVTCFTEVVKMIEKAFKSNCVKLVGGMSDEAKDRAITEFQTGKPQVMVMNIVAGGVGVTLTKSYNMIFNDYSFVPGDIIQAEDRICRGGQTEEYCNVYYLYADGCDVEETLVNTLTYKSETINAVVDGGEGDAIDYLDLINSALEKSTGVKKVRRMIKSEDNSEVPEEKTKKQKSQKTSTTQYKGKTLEELIKMAEEVGAKCKEYDNPSIYRMRLVMAIKKQVGE